MPAMNLLIEVVSDDTAASGRTAGNLVQTLLEVSDVESVIQVRSDSQSMDIGTVLSIVAASASTLALAQGIADWLRARRGVTLIFEKSRDAETLKTTLTGIDPETAERVIARVRQA